MINVVYELCLLMVMLILNLVVTNRNCYMLIEAILSFELISIQHQYNFSNQ